MNLQPVFSSIPKWVLNAPLSSLTREEFARQFSGFRDLDQYEGVMVVPWGNDDYLNDLYFEKYGMALEVARELGMKIIIWDENGFPSGHGGCRFASQHPALVTRQLEKREVPLPRGKSFTLATNGGRASSRAVMGAVMRGADGNYIEVSEGFIPDADTTVLIFECVPSEGTRILKASGARGEHRVHLGRGLRGGDHRHARLDDARFFAGDGRQRITQELLMIQADGRDGAHQRHEHVGGIHAAAHACLDHT